MHTLRRTQRGSTECDRAGEESRRRALTPDPPTPPPYPPNEPARGRRAYRSYAPDTRGRGYPGYSRSRLFACSPTGRVSAMALSHGLATRPLRWRPGCPHGEGSGAMAYRYEHANGAAFTGSTLLRARHPLEYVGASWPAYTVPFLAGRRAAASPWGASPPARQLPQRNARSPLVEDSMYPSATAPSSWRFCVSAGASRVVRSCVATPPERSRPKTLRWGAPRHSTMRVISWEAGENATSVAECGAS